MILGIENYISIRRYLLGYHHLQDLLGKPPIGVTRKSSDFSSRKETDFIGYFAIIAAQCIPAISGQARVGIIDKDDLPYEILREVDIQRARLQAKHIPIRFMRYSYESIF